MAKRASAFRLAFPLAVFLLASTASLLQPAPAPASCGSCSVCKYSVFLGWRCWWPQSDEIGRCCCYAGGVCQTTGSGCTLENQQVCQQ